MNDLRIIIAGGGTGGHLFPALAIGEEIHSRKPNAKIHYVGSIFGLESRVFPIKDVRHTLLPIRGFQRGLTLKSISRNCLLPSRILISLFKINKLIKEILPQLIIGTGGYASALPLYIASRKSNSFPIMLQEQNSFPGLTTRWFAKYAKSICIAFSQSEQKLNGKIFYTGNPVRKTISKGNSKNGLRTYNLNSKDKIIFLFGGSQGSSYLNEMMSKVAENISAAGIQIIWQTGDLEYLKYKNFQTKRIKIIPFINNMADVYAISDLVICRSGALTLAETTVCGKPCILIPFPFAAGDHQTKNANALVNANAAKILSQKSLTPRVFQHSIISLVHNANELTKMSTASLLLGRPNATREIVDHIFESVL